MTVVTQPGYIKREALRAANRIRGMFGLKPVDEIPRGVIGDASDCPMQRLLADAGVLTVDGQYLEFDQTMDTETARTYKKAFRLKNFNVEDFWGEVMTPTAIKRFVEAFDLGEFPELAIKYCEDCGDEVDTRESVVIFMKDFGGGSYAYSGALHRKCGEAQMVELKLRGGDGRFTLEDLEGRPLDV